MELCETCGKGIKNKKEKSVRVYKGENKYYCSEKCFLNTRDIIENKDGLNCWIKHKGVSEKSRIFCDKIEYMHNRDAEEDTFDHHLMFYLNGELVFKVWLKNKSGDIPFNDIDEALDSVDILVKEK